MGVHTHLNYQSMLWFFFSRFAVVLFVAAAETYLSPYLNGTPFSGTTSLQIPRLFGLVILINVVATNFVMFFLGAKVGQSRKTFEAEAEKKGDTDAKKRFAYPKIYAEGFSDLANKFNCVQRGHQQALETYTQFVVMSLIGGVRHPITTSIGGVLWCVARWSWAKGYATGNPNDRYVGFWGVHVWTALFVVIGTSLSTGVYLLTN
eukprot:c413_g1_i1.p2 GENE.c413_g1_i1~~c413_g1_i1.p2  ORF type:complete len:205 (-),score=49.67 c413_g1_i1:82-696(-)